MTKLVNARTWRVPSDSVTLHCFGDTHVGGLTSTRMAHMTQDLNNGVLPDVPVHLQLGDGTDSYSLANDAALLSFMAGISGTKLYVCGNHDLDLNLNTRTPAQWASTYGMPDKNFIYDLPWGVRVLVCGPDSMADGATIIRLSDATMSWLDEQATAAGSMRCVVACHAPIYDTVGHGADVSFEPSSATPGLFVIGGTTASAANSASVLALLAAHPNIVAWISGHTHNSIEAPQMSYGLSVGGHTVAQINTSCVYFTGTGSRGIETFDRVATPYVTFLQDRIQVRWRDHGRKLWTPGHGAPTGFIKEIML